MQLLYSNILPLGTSDDQLTIIDCFKEQLAKADYVEIAVVHEATKAIYNEDGTPQAPDWDLKPEGE